MWIKLGSQNFSDQMQGEYFQIRGWMKGAEVDPGVEVGGGKGEHRRREPSRGAIAIDH